MRRTAVRHALAGGTVTALTGLLLLGAAGPAAAHDQLLESDPADGATVDLPPDAITLTFSDSVLEVSPEVIVETADGTDVADGDPRVEGADVVQPLAADAGAGDYAVSWRVVSADGHPIDGSFEFTVAGAPEPEPADGGDSTDEGGAAASDEPSEEPSAVLLGGDEGLIATNPADDEATDATETPAADDAAGDVPVVPIVVAVVLGLAIGGTVVVLLVRRSRTGLTRGADDGPGSGQADGS
ncbi:hypothetical protein GCM10025865_10020 [Paraoerskovia sediminicola]|uniref:CopC domain-containing protein n=1 Tax=Paraoerskovia sediminicola TaxID=1138587 RepID=A0ABM8G117_9CELL|nr:copper resistance CopC family protein [Paraoerskovia sediminicola]BDZ41703.1 hypothetical protein GCM10025865_10020 [Paraoerskovia sediminicola]